MMFGGLIFYTQCFEEYLSFLTEVLELEVDEVSDTEMSLSVSGQFIKIRKDPHAQNRSGSILVFHLQGEKYFELIARLSFFYYRHDSSRFTVHQKTPDYMEIMDPEGRVWRFEQTLDLAKRLSSELQV